MVGRKGAASSTSLNITTLEGTSLYQVIEYKYLDVWLDNTVSFSLHINKLQAKIKAKLGFIFKMGSTFTPSAKLTLVQMTILPLFNYGDVIYRAACKSALGKLVH